MNPTQQTDVVRGWLMRTFGGVYLDSDVFIVSGRLRQWRRCPIVLGGNSFDPGDYTTEADGGPPAPPSNAYAEERARMGDEHPQT